MKPRWISVYELLYLLQFVDVTYYLTSLFIQLPQLRPGAGTRTALPRLPHGAPAQRPVAAACP